MFKKSKEGISSLKQVLCLLSPLVWFLLSHIKHAILSHTTHPTAGLVILLLYALAALLCVGAAIHVWRRARRPRLTLAVWLILHAMILCFPHTPLFARYKYAALAPDATAAELDAFAGEIAPLDGAWFVGVIA